MGSGPNGLIVTAPCQETHPRSEAYVTSASEAASDVLAGTVEITNDQLDGIEDRMALAERAAILTLLLEPVLALLRRLAQEGESRRRTAEAAAAHTAQPGT
ncbi:hypothetical protein [Streptomyces sp. NPDC051286]|uniref:hypothetical protein n=1 Tax=Streptomyces sp. NPDC051286 TaxID=3365647 RepID=UPI00378D1220